MITERMQQLAGVEVSERVKDTKVEMAMRKHAKEAKRLSDSVFRSTNPNFEKIARQVANWAETLIVYAEDGVWYPKKWEDLRTLREIVKNKGSLPKAPNNPYIAALDFVAAKLQEPFGIL